MPVLSMLFRREAGWLASFQHETSIFELEICWQILGYYGDVIVFPDPHIIIQSNIPYPHSFDLCYVCG